MRIKLLLTNLQNEKKPDSQILEVDKSYCVIGRKNADLVLEEPRCSKQHAVLYQAFDGSLHIRDMGSTNGTFVNGVKIIDATLETGNEIRIGKCFLSVLGFESVQKTGIRGFQEPIVNVSAKEATGSKGTAMDSLPPAGSQPPRLPLMRSRSSVDSNPFVHFVDEEGTENRLDFNDLIRELERSGPDIAPRKVRLTRR